MSSDGLESVQKYFLNKEWILAKEELLRLHLKHKYNTSILCKLGDCCMKLSEYDLAKQCYTKCINYSNYYFNVRNARYYMKLAHLYQIYYDPYSLTKNDVEQLYAAQLLYQDILSFKDLRANIKYQCHFNYAQLLTKLKQFESAASHYEILLKLISHNNLYDVNKYGSSQIHYYYAQLLFIMNKKSDICYHFERCISLKPDDISYYYKYASILTSLGDDTKSSEILSRAYYIEEEDEEEEEECEEMSFMDKIEVFITMTESDTHCAHKYMNISSGDLNRAINIYMEDIEKRSKNGGNKWRNKKRKRKKKNKKVIIADNKIEKKQTMRLKSNSNVVNDKLLPPIIFNDPRSFVPFSCIKLVIFDVSVLAYLHSFKATKNMSTENIYHTDTLYVLDMFGGRDRIERLKVFFENIASINIEMMVISGSEKSDNIAEALRRVHLFNFFKSSIICGSEVINCIKTQKDAVNDVFINKKLIWINNYIAKKARMNCGINKNNVLLIDKTHFIENKSAQICSSIVIDHGFDFLLETDFIEIETRIQCKIASKSSFLQYPLSKSLSSINYTLYRDIKFEILNNLNNNNISSYITSRCNTVLCSSIVRDCFYYFFSKFRLIQECQHQHQSWIVLNLCFELMHIETMDSDLCRSLAMALSEYQYFADAEFYFKKSLEIFPGCITSLKAYAYFLFMLERYDEASDIFEAALDINPMSKKAILGYARSLSFLKEHDRAEKYFKKCIEYYKEWDLAHFRYGKFLYLLERYQEAKQYLFNAVSIWSHSARSHLYLAQCYDKLGDVEQFEFHLNEALKLEPEHHEAINKWQRHYQKTYNASYFRRKKFVKQHPKIRPNQYNWNTTNQTHSATNDSNEFRRFWCHYVSFMKNEKKKDEYFNRFCATNLNDIKLILYESDEGFVTILRSKVGITSNNDIEYILNARQRYKTMHNKFKKWLNKICKLDIDYFIKKHQIYCLDQLIQFGEKQFKLLFGKEQEMTAKYVWKCIQNEKDKYYNNNKRY